MVIVADVTDMAARKPLRWKLMKWSLKRFKIWGLKKSLVRQKSFITADFEKRGVGRTDWRDISDDVM